ncbi:MULTISPECIES: LacI family DNA-binding transcriptional regulator [unclassified Aureimonas]|uniref:LacI family DNA-binding transcriptional regulator n=1 Tax=unclassified Aureimonas TaxID=2615206 RepID=UPI000701D5CB|nr:MULTISPECIES: LacI family DNA-binding transcriptional regulator [unclassified Aureimonas]KQT62923.1 LacI family transcriptional regulator [Aureimonas sp. Leaf427]KQT74839.1 LacI family transcriptional regulator [Aureimonas sp. Leaf460]
MSKAGNSQKPPTIRDVARESGVSIATVSRFFSGKSSAVAPETSESVRRAAESLGYTPSEIGRSLRLARSRVVVVLVPSSTNHFTTDVSASLESALNAKGLSMVLANTEEDPDKQDGLLSDAQGLRAKAVVLQGAIDTPKLREMAARQNNLIFVNRQPAPGIVAPYVGIDNFAAGFAVGRYFVQRDYQNFVAIHGPRQYAGSSARLDGFLAGIGEAGPVMRFESPFSMEGGYRYGTLLAANMSQRYAVFCGNDEIAYGVYRAATERQLQVPDQMVICGFDDNRLNEWLAPWLTTVKVPAFDFGPAIADLIEKVPTATKSCDRFILPFSLIQRQSA